jgi:hypothetical protein
MSNIKVGDVPVAHKADAPYSLCSDATTSGLDFQVKPVSRRRRRLTNKGQRKLEKSGTKVKVFEVKTRPLNPPTTLDSQGGRTLN